MATTISNRRDSGFCPLHLLFDGPPLFCVIGRQTVFEQTGAGELVTFPGVLLVGGRTLCGRWGTTAREADVVRLN